MRCKGAAVAVAAALIAPAAAQAETVSLHGGSCSSRPPRASAT